MKTLAEAQAMESSETDARRKAKENDYLNRMAAIREQNFLAARAEYLSNLQNKPKREKRPQ